MLELDSVCRSYSGRQVLHDVSFSARRGRLTGFVGGNGAGKTTTMRITLGVLDADSGTVRLDGTPVSPASRVRFGYMPEERGLYPKMRVAEQLSYLARLHGFDRHEARRRAEALLARLDLSERGDDPLESLSLGNQQRVQIAAALIHDPDVLILDEPFSGLDPMAVEVVLSVLTEQAEAGAVVLFSSHQLDVVERLCDDLVIIGAGRILAEGGREELRERHGTRRYELVTEDDAGWVRDVPDVEIDESAAGRVLFRAGAETAQQVLQRAAQQGPVLRFTPLLPSLSEIFKDVAAQVDATQVDATEPRTEQSTHHLEKEVAR
ncbi:ABC transporter ATP-binding protein [Nesterenkonia xinjiangensis]|uniref:ABC-2 type transport system ATP-binding protein n=1 Tax=Nesterenkonia xinjiangensis TaxID=225327 RepID=A0A7Z0GMC6_9MICC|nr:ATP-binding cassette domain-containing protein [Nesterenkonia xinjiangensis]NYJ78630.1 ABC-2 type transport system ATP-binding protein [Nesterenkonia xinjiangensis]